MTALPAQIGCSGEVMLELVMDGSTDARLGVAGDTYNTAVYLARRLDTGAVDYITVLGSDSFSDRILGHMATHGVGNDRILSHTNRMPGLYAIETDETGERSFSYWRSASAARCFGDVDLPSIDTTLTGLTHLFYSGVSLAILPQANRDRLFDALAAFRAKGGIVAFDSNYRPKLWEDEATARREIERAWMSCDIALPSIDDEMVLFEDADENAVLARFEQYGVERGVLKRGAQGPISLKGQAAEISPAPIRVIDTTAAGDSFNAAYLAALINGQPQSAAMRAGHDLAAQVIGHRGAIIPEEKDIS